MGNGMMMAMSDDIRRRREHVFVTSKGVSIMIRDFVADDLVQVVEIDRASLLGGSAEIYAALAGISSRTSSTTSIDIVENPMADVFLVAVPASSAAPRSEVLGFIVTVPVSDEVSRIFALAVRPEHRGKGIGKALLKAALSELRRLRRSFVRLEVRESNSIAQNLYKSMNFSEVGYIPLYYFDGEGAIIMQKVL